MKKQYIPPTTQVVMITHQCNILTNSPGVGINSKAAVKDGEVLSRQGDAFWDDDE